MSQPRSEQQASLGEEAVGKIWNLRLYVAGDSPRSRTAVINLRRLCERYLQGRHQVEIIDLLKDPDLAKLDHIVVIPTLIREQPEPMTRVVGDLSDAEEAFVALDTLDMRVRSVR